MFSPDRSPRRAVVLTLIMGVIVLALLGAVTLTRAAPRVVRIGAPGIKAIHANGERTIAHFDGQATICQAGETLPAGVSAIRLSMWVFVGAPVHLWVLKGTRVLTEGRRGAEWTSDSVTVPVKPVRRSVFGTQVCFSLSPNQEPISILGNPVSGEPATISEAGLRKAMNPATAAVLEGRLAIEYLAPEHRSWWSRLLPVARRLGLGRSFSGSWIAVVIAMLMAGVGVLTLRLATRESS
jgi:hypothetical protein